jgi:hypothetical protein
VLHRRHVGHEPGRHDHPEHQGDAQQHGNKTI